MNFSSTREAFNCLNYEILYSLCQDLLVDLSVYSNNHDFHVITHLWSYFGLVQNDDKMDLENEGNVVISFYEFQDGKEKKDLTVNIYD